MTGALSPSRILLLVNLFKILAIAVVASKKVSFKNMIFQE